MSMNVVEVSEALLYLHLSSLNRFLISCHRYDILTLFAILRWSNDGVFRS